MGRVSRRKIDPEIEERIFEIFSEHIASLNKPSSTQEFLESLLTYTEKVMLAKRLSIAVLLSKGYKYELINNLLKVSMSTVSSVDKQLQSGALGYKKAVDRILKEERMENFWNRLEELSLRLSLPKAYGSVAWQAKSKQGKKIRKRERKLAL